MLGNATPTPIDLRFPLLGIPVRVHPFFWLFSAVLFWQPRAPIHILMGIECAFVSILVHEYGHALMGRVCGCETHEVVLYAFGGYAAVERGRRLTTTQSVLISLAGPGAGFVLWGVVWCVTWFLKRYQIYPDDPQQYDYLVYVLGTMLMINLWWGLFNLLPVFPLDGGRVSRDLLTHYRYRDGLEISLKISLLVAGGLAAYCLMHRQMFNGMLFASLAFDNLQQLQGSRYI